MQRIFSLFTILFLLLFSSYFSKLHSSSYYYAYDYYDNYEVEITGRDIEEGSIIDIYSNYDDQNYKAEIITKEYISTYILLTVRLLNNLEEKIYKIYDY